MVINVLLIFSDVNSIQRKSSKGRNSSTISNEKLVSSSSTAFDHCRSSSLHTNNEKEMFGVLSDIVEEGINISVLCVHKLIALPTLR